MLWKWKTKHGSWGWGLRMDKKGEAHDSFVFEKKAEKPVKSKWSVKRRGAAKLKPASAR